MSNSFLKPIAVALMLAVAPLSISNVQAAAVKVGSYVGIWNAKTSYAAGDLITLNNKTFLSLVARNLNKNPETNTALWQLLGGVGATGLQGPIGAQGIQGLKGDTGLAGASGTGAGVLKVFDANHNVIGDFHDAYRQVFMDINGKTYSLAVASDGFGENIYHNTPFYSTNDCTGTAYYSFQVYNTNDFGLNDYLWVANKIYEFDHTKAVSITANSMLDLNSCYNQNNIFTPRTIQAELFEDLILIQDLSVYPTPFTVGKE